MQGRKCKREGNEKMKILSGMPGACLEVLCYCAALSALERRLQLPVHRSGKKITDKAVWAAGCLLFGAAFAYSVCHSGESSSVLYLMTMVLLWGMAVLSITDAKMQVIPNRMLLFLLAVWAGLLGIQVLFDLERGTALFALSLAGGLAGGLAFLLCYAVSRGQLGAGDVKLAAVMGLYLTGQRIIGAVFYGVLLCCMYSLVLLCCRKIGLKDGVPLVPFLFAGMCVTLLLV